MPEHVMLAVLVGLALAVIIPTLVAIPRDWNPNPYNTGVELPETADPDLQYLADVLYADACERAGELLVPAIPEPRLPAKHRAGRRKATIGAELLGSTPRKAAHR